MAELRELSTHLGHPSASKLYQAVQREKLPISRKAVFDFVHGQSARQVFKPRPKYQGKVTAVEINDRWAADLIDYTAKPSTSKAGESPYQYILIVQDIFSRKIFVHALRSKSPEVVEQAFASIVHRAGIPDRLDTDDGVEFKGPFDHFLVEEGIYHQIADSRNKNARATLDAAIKVLRQQLARIQTVEGHRNWTSVLQRAANAYNDTVHTALIGRAPDDVVQDKTLQFDLRWRAGQDMEHNSHFVEAREKRLQRHGAFRVEQQQKDFERSFNPRYSDAVHKVKEVVGSYVVDEEGRKFPTRHVHAVPALSGPVDTSGMHGGSEQVDRQRSQAIEPFRQRIEAYVADGKWEFEVAAYMKTLDMAPLMKNGLNYRKALLLLGFAVNDKGRVTKPGPAAPVAAAAAPVGPSRFRINAKRPELSPAQAAAALAAPAVRRRIGSKQPEVHP